MFKSSSKAVVSRVFKNKNEIKKPEILIMEETLLEFKAYVDSCEKEIGWLAFVRKEKDNKYVIYDTILPKQEVSAVTTELTEEGLQDISEEILMTRPDEFNNIRCWCHSHVNMAVFPSGTDEETFEQFYENCEYFIRVICNKKKDIRIDFVDLVQEVRFDNIEWNFYTMPETEAKYIEIEQYEAAIKEAQEYIAKLRKDITEEQNKVYNRIKSRIEFDVKKKLEEEKSKYQNTYGNYYKTNGKKDYGYNYNTYDYDYDYAYGYDSFLEDVKVSVNWNKLSKEDKEKYCELSGILLLDSTQNGREPEYLEPLSVMTREEVVKMLEASTLSELKALLKKHSFATNYTDDDWHTLYEELDYFGITEIEEMLEKEINNGYRL